MTASNSRKVSITWPLSWPEIHQLVQIAGPLLQGARVDRVVVPQRKSFIKGYLKSDWLIRLHSTQHGPIAFHFNLRSGKPFFSLLQGKGPRAAQNAPRSGFDLLLNKDLQGAQILSFEAIPRERAAVLWLKTSSSSQILGLALIFIPARPEAVLVSKSDDEKMTVLCSSRNKTFSAGSLFQFPSGSNSPQSPPHRNFTQLDKSQPWEASFLFHRDLNRQAFLERSQRCLKHIQSEIKNRSKAIEKTQKTLFSAKKEPDWSRHGILLQGSLHLSPPLELDQDSAYREVIDYETQKPVRIPVDEKLSATQQVEKFFQKEKRKKRRINESQKRLEEFKLEKNILEEKLTLLKSLSEENRETLEEIEKSLGFESRTEGSSLEKRGKSRRWEGLTFQSTSGELIWVGKNLKENQKLTFQKAKGNDLWLHVQGKPGAHVVIPLNPGKSPELETLLDAAALCVYYSGGEKWGKTAVDYTYIKHVKRIKNSKEVSYSQNKTLILDPQEGRMNTLKDNKIQIKL